MFIIQIIKEAHKPFSILFISRYWQSPSAPFNHMHERTYTKGLYPHTGIISYLHKSATQV